MTKLTNEGEAPREYVMSNYLRIERIPYEEPYHVQLVWSVSNGRTSSSFEYYANAEALNEIAPLIQVYIITRHRFG